MQGQVTTGCRIGVTVESMEIAFFFRRVFIREGNICEDNPSAAANVQPERLNSSTEINKREQFNEI